MGLRAYYAVLDASALISYLTQDANHQKVSGYLKQALHENKPIALSSVNWGEVYYVLYRILGKERVDIVFNSIEKLPITVVHTDDHIVKKAAMLKAHYQALSYADCYAAALAALLDVRLITSDKGFAPLRKKVKLSLL